jgi:hypothetical protein
VDLVRTRAIAVEDYRNKRQVDSLVKDRRRGAAPDRLHCVGISNIRCRPPTDAPQGPAAGARRPSAAYSLPRLSRVGRENRSDPNVGKCP